MSLNLLLALNFMINEIQLRDALAGVISSCTFEKIDPFTVPMFDIEFLFLRIRGKSVGEKIDLSLLCPDDNETRVKTSVNLEDVNVNMKEGHTNQISITDKIKPKIINPKLPLAAPTTPITLSKLIVISANKTL